MTAPAPDADMNETEYYLVLDDKEQGPFTIGQLRSLWNAGKIRSKTYYFQAGMSGWTPLAQILLRLEPPPINDAAPTIIKTAKSRGIYIILGIFFGMLGIHNFYAGYNRKGGLQIVFCCLGVMVARAGLDTSALGGLMLMAVFLSVIVDLRDTKTDAQGDPLV